MFGRYADRNAGYPVAVAAAVLAVAATLLAACDRKTPEAAVTQVQTEAPTTPAEPDVQGVPEPPPALTRGDLVSAAAQAASAYAEGKPYPAADPLVGRSFAVRLAFGCNGPIPPSTSKNERNGLAGWSWGPDKKTIQLSMTPGDWADSALLFETGAAEKWEAVEGVWIPRPWLASEACPVFQADPLQTEALPASPQTVGLAAVFETGGSRIGRRNGRAYQLTIGAKGDEPIRAPEGGYRMVLQGRIATFPNGRAIVCRAPRLDQRPICIIAVQLDRVAYEDANGGTLSEWRTG